MSHCFLPETGFKDISDKTYYFDIRLDICAQIIVFADLDTRMPENGVTNADVKIDIGEHKACKIIDTLEGLWFTTDRKSDVPIFRTNQY
jgi:hypothetical protein